jgi:Zn-dependent protease/CBS domain-containing protein
VRVDFSWFVIFGLILWSFTDVVFPSQLPGYSTWTYGLMGLAGGLLFFVSLLLHELSHSVVARAKGIPVEGITLFIFGGVARTRLEAAKPGDEFVIAGVGPLMSLAIAAVLWAFAWAGARLGIAPPVLAVAGYLALLNLILAVFNLLPGFPLDGGRLLRSVVWHWTKDLKRATRIASTGGRWLGYVLIALGLLQAFNGVVISGLWLVFIGWFLRNAAVASYRQHLVRDLLSDLTARQTMTPVPDTVPAHTLLRDLMDDWFLRRRFVAYPVVDGERAVGIVTLHQVKQVAREEWNTRTAADVMAPADAALVVRPEEDMLAVVERVRQSPVRRLLVIRDGELEGIITPTDLARVLERAQQTRDV